MRAATAARGRGRRHGRGEGELTLGLLNEARRPERAIAGRVLGVLRQMRSRLWNKPRVVAVMKSREHRGVSPKQLVPRFADEGINLASESTMYRSARETTTDSTDTLHEQRRSTALSARIKYGVGTSRTCRRPVRGRYLFLYLVVDVWSRCIVGWRVRVRESARDDPRQSATIAGSTRRACCCTPTTESL